MSAPEVRTYDDADALAQAVGNALIDATIQAQRARGDAHLVLTGGGVGIALLAALRTSPRASGIDWARVHLWWGDERFVPEGDPDRNDTQARDALLDHVPLDPAHVHPMPVPGVSLVDAAAAYADELRREAPAGSDLPEFDVLLLGMGPEGHVASLFPDSAAVHAAGTVVAVPDSPKPPPERISLTLPALRSARSVWLVTAGSAKAEAVARCVAPGTDPVDLPAAGARGRESTLLWVDREAAALLG
ncbi:MAG: 6-phosphogluconolactonase [Candidatus Nanopelagicales bacterium]